MKFKKEILSKIQINLLLNEIDSEKFKSIFIISIVDLLRNNKQIQIIPFNKLQLKENNIVENIVTFLKTINDNKVDEEELLLGFVPEEIKESLKYNVLLEIIERIKKYLLKQKFQKSKIKNLHTIQNIEIQNYDENEIFFIPQLKKKSETKLTEFNQEDEKGKIDLANETVVPENIANVDFSIQEDVVVENQELNLESNDINSSEEIQSVNEEINNDVQENNEEYTEFTEEDSFSKPKIDFGEREGLLEDFVDDISFTETEIELEDEVAEEIKPLSEDKELLEIISIAQESSNNQPINLPKENEVKKKGIFEKIKIWWVKKQINKSFSVNVKPPKEKKSKKVKEIKEITSSLEDKIVIENKVEDKVEKVKPKKEKNKLFTKFAVSDKVKGKLSLIQILTFEDVKSGIIFYFTISILFAGLGAGYWFYVYKMNKSDNIFNQVNPSDEKIPIKMIIIERDNTIPADEFIVEEINQINLDEKNTAPSEIKKESNIDDTKKTTKSYTKEKKNVIVKQMSAWSSEEKAEIEVKKYKKQGYDAFIEKAIINGMEIYRVKIRTK
jgi:hypothetical protein